MPLEHWICWVAVGGETYLLLFYCGGKDIWMLVGQVFASILWEYYCIIFLLGDIFRVVTSRISSIKTRSRIFYIRKRNSAVGGQLANACAISNPTVAGDPHSRHQGRKGWGGARRCHGSEGEGSWWWFFWIFGALQMLLFFDVFGFLASSDFWDL